MTDRPDISVLIVNWRSGALTRALVAALREQRFEGRDGGQGTMEFIVTDNASGEAEEAHLCALEDDGVTVLRSAQNGGYAVGMNLAAEQARGDTLLISNPDVMPFAGAVEALREHLASHEGCGLAGPRGYLDRQCFFLLPPVELPTLCDLAGEALARSFTGWGRRHAAARSRRALRSWTATEPISTSMISGFCFMIDADLARELGPFTAEYPFYFEDADLCRRVRAKGFTTDLVPRSRMVHFFNRSASQAQTAAMARYEVSRALFFKRRYPLIGAPLYALLDGAAKAGPGRGHLYASIDDLGVADEGPTIDVPYAGSYLAEISADPGFTFAAGRLDISRRFSIPDEVWAGLDPAKYYVRFLERRSLDVVRVVSVSKTGPATGIEESAPRAAREPALAGA